MKVIMLTGKAGSGKDTAAQMIKDLLPGLRVAIAHFAAPLKQFCKDYLDWNGEKDDAGRTLLQQVGTEYVRSVCPDFWANYTGTLFGACREKFDWLIIPDARYNNELTAFNGFSDVLCYMVRVVRTGYLSELSVEQQAHASENGVSELLITHTLYNEGSIDDLRCKVEELVRCLQV